MAVNARILSIRYYCFHPWDQTRSSGASRKTRTPSGTRPPFLGPCKTQSPWKPFHSQCRALPPSPGILHNPNFAYVYSIIALMSISPPMPEYVSQVFLQNMIALRSLELTRFSQNSGFPKSALIPSDESLIREDFSKHWDNTYNSSKARDGNCACCPHRPKIALRHDKEANRWSDPNYMYHATRSLLQHPFDLTHAHKGVTMIGPHCIMEIACCFQLKGMKMLKIPLCCVTVRISWRVGLRCSLAGLRCSRVWSWCSRSFIHVLTSMADAKICK